MIHFFYYVMIGVFSVSIMALAAAVFQGGSVEKQPITARVLSVVLSFVIIYLIGIGVADLMGWRLP